MEYGPNDTERINQNCNGTEDNSKISMALKEVIKMSMTLREFTSQDSFQASFGGSIDLFNPSK